ncbi:MAG: hypothetical protein H7A33_03705 [Deltaproteobacteria bacterium]|nr:hypothetical protein [Deltaproteobacteria bacterium]
MIAIIVISENKAAENMLKTVSKVLGKRQLKNMKSVILKSHFKMETLNNKLHKALLKYKDADGILLLTELYGSTQSTVCQSFLRKNKIDLLSGYNLAMLLKAASLNTKKLTLSDLVKELKKTGRDFIKQIKEND